MSGHSKWSKVKHQKATTDVAKAAAFTRASRGITIAVAEGGGIGDPEKNFKLRLAVEKAHQVNMPKENIARAIEKGLGSGQGALESVTYEAYGPGGVALVIEAATDNRNRTVSAVKNLLDRAGGALAAPGAVGFLFRRTGVLVVLKGGQSYDKVLEESINSGADDVVEAGDAYEVYAPVPQLAQVKDALAGSGLPVEAMEIVMRPVSTVPLADWAATQLESLVTQLEALDDVTQVFTNST